MYLIAGEKLAEKVTLWTLGMTKYPQKGITNHI